MNRDEIKKLLQSLAKSQGKYRRALRHISEQDKDMQEAIWEHLEAKKFKDLLDVIFYFES